MRQATVKGKRGVPIPRHSTLHQENVMKYLLAVMLILTSGVAYAQPCCPTPAECPNPKCECDPCTCGPDCACDGTGCECPGCQTCPFEITVTVVDPAQQAYDYFNTLNEQEAMKTLQMNNAVVGLAQRGLLSPDVMPQYTIAKALMTKIADMGIGAALVADAGDPEDKLRAAADLAGMLKLWAVPQKMFADIAATAKPPAPPRQSET
jgi:hypothetical protein